MADIIIDKNVLEAIKITAGLDDAGLIMVQFFAEGVKARAEWERQREKEQKAG
jgi:hypothetical protein